MIQHTRLMRGHKRATFIVTNMASVACKINRRISIQQPPYLSVKHSKQSEASSLICQTFSCKEDPGRIVEKQEVILSSQITMAIRPHAHATINHMAIAPQAIARTLGVVLPAF
jgi:hypothetical protein